MARRRTINHSDSGSLRAISRSPIVASVTGVIYTLSKFGLKSPVTFAKAGGNANLAINSSTGAISATAAIAAGASQSINGTATGSDGVVIPWALTLTCATSTPTAGYAFVTSMESGGNRIIITTNDGSAIRRNVQTRIAA